MIWLATTFGLIRSASWLGLVDFEGVENRPAGRPHLGLDLVVDLEQAEQPLDDLHPGPHLGGLEGDVGDPVDLDSGRDLHPQRCVPGQRQETARHCAQIGRVLRLE
jgi:hypothetical protein